MAVGPHRRVSLLTAVLGLQAGLSLCYAQTVRRVVDVAPVWSGHPVGFHSLVASNRQFVAFYDAERQMTLAMRSLPSTNWTFIRLPERVGWDSHNYVTAALDASGHLHVSGNLHVKPLVYFRTERPLDITTLKRVSAMTGRDEQRATYPRFFTGPRGELIFTYRNGASGNGDQIYNVYAPETRTWQRLLDQPLLDGEGRKNAYLHGPNRGPDGFFHLCWIWRETPVCSTSHYVCYARSRDLVHWETSESKPLELPITFKTAEVIDPVPIHGGAINGNVVLGFDAQKRHVASNDKGVGSRQQPQAGMNSSQRPTAFELVDDHGHSEARVLMRLVADDDHFRKAALQQGQGARDHGLAANPQERLVDAAHATVLSASQDQRTDMLRQPRIS